MSNILRERYAVPVLIGALVSVLALLLVARVADRESTDAIVEYRQDILPPPPPPPPPPVLELSDDIDDHYVVVEQQPTLMGGLAGLVEQIQYPQIAKAAGVEGRVLIQFVVDEDGNVQDATVLRGIGAGCDEEALRVVNQTKFIPGMQSGENVKVKMTLPVMFKLS